MKLEIFRQCILDDIPLAMCFSRENGCIESKNNYHNKKILTTKRLHFWDCDESMIRFIAQKLHLMLQDANPIQDTYSGCGGITSHNIN